MAEPQATTNPYETPQESWQPPRHSPGSRGLAFAISVTTGFVGAFFGWQVLVIFAFSTMIGPEINDRERAQLIADKFLFGDGPLQIVFITVFLLLAIGGIVSCVTYLICAIFQRPSLRWAFVISGGATFLITVSVLGWLLAVRSL